MYFDSYAAGYRIQKLRKAHGLTQEEAAINLNISDRHMRSLEKGTYTPNNKSMRSRRAFSGFFFCCKKIKRVYVKPEGKLPVLLLF